MIKNPLIIGLKLDRATILARIKDRLEERLKAGMIAEVNELLNNGLSLERLKYFGLEYRFIGEYLSEKWDFNRLSLNMPAKSNCSIFRDTTNFLLYNYKKLNLSYENLFLIIEWSGLARYSYFNREKMGWEIYHLWKFDVKKDKLHPGKNMDYHSIIE